MEATYCGGERHFLADPGLSGSRSRVDLGNPCSARTTHAGIR